MRRNGWALAIVATAALLAACAAPPPPPPVSIQGQPLDFALLAGEWSGQYVSADTGRTGTIHFDLVAGEDHAHGEVVLYMDPPDAPVRTSPSLEAHAHTLSKPLAIRFVALDGGQISGTLEPYEDPECARCIVTTTFTGRLRGNVIEGAYVSHGGAAGTPRQGTWRVTRPG